MKSDIICLQLYKHRSKENVKKIFTDSKKVLFDNFLVFQI